MARPAVHLAVSTGLAAVQWLRTGRVLPTVAPLVTGFLIDSDHLVDYFRYRNRGQAEGRVVLPFHGWEYLVALALIERLFGQRFAGGLVLGYVGHLLVDQFTNTITHPLTYFISFRWLRGFDTKLFAHPDESHVDWMQKPVFNLWRHF
jgi:hypothetical protein